MLYMSLNSKDNISADVYVISSIHKAYEDMKKRVQVRSIRIMIMLNVKDRQIWRGKKSGT